MKSLKRILMIGGLLVGLSLTVSAQDGKDKKKDPPPKKDPPVVVVDKGKDKDKPKDPPRGQRPKKPAEEF